MQTSIPRAPLVVFLVLAAAMAAHAEDCDPQADAKTILENEAIFVAKGQVEDARAASLTWLADDAIMFEPGPVSARKVWEARGEALLSLKWEPALAVMARSCDLAFTTGPAEWRKDKADEKPLGHGQYISIWKKQPDGAWKVAVDVGGAVPSGRKVEDGPTILISDTPPEPTPSAAAAAKKLRAAEKWFLDTAQTDSTSALVGASSAEIRVHREGVFPGQWAPGRGVDVERAARKTNDRTSRWRH